MIEKLDKRLVPYDRVYPVYSALTEQILLRLNKAKSLRLQGLMIKANGGHRYKTVRISDGAILEFDLLNRCDSFILAEIESTGSFEAPTTAYIANNLHQGDVFVDAGANIGYYTILTSHLVGKGGVVYAFEPVPSTLERLNRNVGLNGLGNVSVIPKATWNEEKVLTLYLSDVQDGMNSLSAAISHSRSIEVEAATVDSVVGSGRVAMLKVDVEGSERETLQGSRTMIASGRCAKIIVEWARLPRLTVNELDARFEYFNRLGDVRLISRSRASGSYELLGPIRRRRDLPGWCNLLIEP